ncbi:MAG: prolyl oligopeptidase family serine peptidase, partial [Alphaproteobacteria bacterium]
MRYASGLAAALLALGLSACGDQSRETDETTQDETAEISGEDIKLEPSEPVSSTPAVESSEPAIDPDARDPFLWLEEVESEKALDWVREQNARSRKVLEGDPRFEPFKEQALDILTAPDRIPTGTYRGGYVYNFWQDDDHVRGIWRRATLESYRSDDPDWEVLLDIDKLAEEEDENWVFKGVDCLPPAYDRCMIQLSRGGKDASVFREWDLPTRAFVNRGFKIREAKTWTAWLDRDTLLVGTDWGEDSLTTSGYPRIIKKWKRGTFISDAETVAEGEKSDVAMWPSVIHRPEGKVAIINRAVDFFNSIWLVVKEDGSTVELPVPTHAEVEGVYEGQILFTLRKAWKLEAGEGEGGEFAQGSLIAFDLNSFLDTATLPAIDTLFTPDERSSVSGVSTTRDTVVVSLLSNVTSKMLAFDYEDGEWRSETVKLPGDGTAAVSSSDNFNNVAFVNFEGYLTPDTLLQANLESGEVTPVKSLPARFDASGMTVERFEAESKDGTKVPYWVVRPEDAEPDGSLPTLLYAYGGFEIPLTPRYRATWGKLWLENGGAFVIANIRGGGEFGPRWHEAGLKINRQRVYDDFAAVSKDLIERKITSARRLGIMGGSNGGLLVGVAFTQHPELYHAVVCAVPLLDMIRYVDLPPGASWMGEYGDPSIPEERKVLASYSPYHNLEKDADYPKVFFLTSTKDDRVHPGHARKMAARMAGMGHEFLYYENIEGGHSASANLLQQADNMALEFVYLARRL